jgi:uncharacterized repeat protein (TIGR01451 family)
MRAQTIARLAAVAGALVALPARAQPFPVAQSFQNQSAPGWALLGSARLTGGSADPAGQGWLQLTDGAAPTLVAQRGAAVYQTPFASSTGLVATFIYATYGGAEVGAPSGADGFAFFLLDGSRSLPVQPGAGGASLGYSQYQSTCGGILDEPGIAGGYIGVGFDEFGAFRTCSYGTSGFTTGQPDSVVVRGAESNRFQYLAGAVTSASPWYASVATGGRAAARPVRISIVKQKLTVEMDFGAGYEAVLAGYDLSAAPGQPPLPASFRMGFGGGTGSHTNYHEVRAFNATLPVFLRVAHEASPAVVSVGDLVTYTVTVGNDDTNDVTGVALSDLVPAGITGVTWTASAQGGATASSATGSGDAVTSTLDLPRSSSVTFVVTGRAAASAAGSTITHAAAVTPPPGATNLGTGSATASVAVSEMASAVAVSAPPSAALGSPVILGATASAVPPGGGTPTGTVTFLDGPTVLGAAPLDASGHAALTVPGLALGAHAIGATYSGDARFTPSASAATAPLAISAATTLTVVPSAAAPVSGQRVTFTVTVSSPGGVPTGAVELSDGGALLATAPLGGAGTATLAAAFRAGAHALAVSYGGDASYLPAGPEALSYDVARAATSLALTSAPDRTRVNQPVTLTVNAAASPGAGVPSGSVRFTDGDVLLGSATLDATGRALFTVGSLTAGEHLLAARYDGADDFLPAAAEVAATVERSAPVAGSGWAVAFDGAVQDAVVADAAGATGAARTVELWFEDAGGDGAGCLVEQGQEGALRFGLCLTAARDGLEVRRGADRQVVPLHLEAGWHHAALVADGSDTVLYLDGEAVASLDGGFGPGSARRLLLAAAASGAGRADRFAGRLDELRLWSVARSASELRATMKIPVAGDAPGLLALWRMDEGGGDALFDAGPNHLPAALEGAGATTWVPSEAWRRRATRRDQPLDPFLSGYDPGGEPFTVSIVTPPGSGQAAPSGAAVAYVPDAGFVGIDSFTYRLSGAGGTSQYTIEVEVARVALCRVQSDCRSDELCVRSSRAQPLGVCQAPATSGGCGAGGGGGAAVLLALVALLRRRRPPRPAGARPAFRLPPLSQRSMVVALFAGLLAVLSASLAIWLPARIGQQAQALIEARAQEVTRLAGAAAAPALDFDDRVSAMRVLGHFKSARGAAYAVLVREGDGVLATWNEPAGGAPLAAAGGEAVLYRDGLLHLRVPLTTRTGHRGALLAGFHLDDLEARRHETRTFVVAASAVVFAVGLLGTLLLGTLLVRPLQEITAVARRIAAGDVGAATDLPLVRGDEAGAVARALSQMLARLYEQRATIENLAASLEQRVADRTAQLEATNRELAQRLAELKQTQDQLIVADRRISIGRLAAGAAHEINNPLAFIMANLTYATDELQRTGQLARAEDPLALERHLAQIQGALEDSLQGAGRVHQIVRGLKTFARADDDRRAPVSVEEAVNAAIHMSANQIKHRARLVREISPAPLVDANHVRLSQVFLNLLLNAVQSIPEGAAGGSIRVTVGTDERGWSTAEVRDNGVGIPEEHLLHIFDPFFTTKPVGSGTGLGLSISQGIVAALGGEITVGSEVSVGTTFRVSLPPSAASHPTPPPSPRPAPAAARRRKVLVVDDEPLVGASIQRALERRHDVTVASSGREALDLILGGAGFDHILCDVMMPEMTGMELHARLVEFAPEQAARVTFMTAGPFTESASAFVERHKAACLEKPIDFERLSEIVDGEA